MDDAAAGAADGGGSGNASAGAADEDEPRIEGMDKTHVRHTIAEMKSKYVVENTPAPTVAPDVVRLVTRFAERSGTTFGTLDVRGAHYLGVAPDVDATGDEFGTLEVRGAYYLGEAPDEDATGDEFRGGLPG